MVSSFQPALPWTGAQVEDLRFRRILTQVLVICLVIGVIVPNIPVPLPKPDTVINPPRLVRVITAPVVAAVSPKTDSPKVPEKTIAERLTSPPAKTARRPARPKPGRAAKREAVKSPRQRAGQAGVLAMTDALSELRNIAPLTPSAGRRGSPLAGAEPTPRKTRALSAGVTRGSDGVDAGVGHQAVLGEAALPQMKAGGGMDRGASGQAQMEKRDRSSAETSRSQAEIQEVLDRNKNAMYMIYNKALRKQPALRGKLVMSVTIAPSGRVTRCEIIDSELNAPTLERQLILLVKAIDFGNRPGVSSLTTRVPIEFFPQ